MPTLTANMLKARNASAAAWFDDHIAVEAA